MAITAADVKALRERTGLPLMDCKKALTAAGGDQDKAVEELRKRGQTVMGKRQDRETAFGRFGLYVGTDKSTGAIVELLCESAPVAGSEEFIALADSFAEQLATGPGAADGEALLDQPSPGKSGSTLREHRDELFNRMREVFNVGRLHRFDTATGGYGHNLGTVSGVLISVEGSDDEAAKDISMHIAAMRPEVLSTEQLDQAEVDKERGILREAALAEGKPEKIVDKMVEGRLKNFYAERVLLEQPFVKEEKMSVAEYAKSKGLTVKDFVRYELGVKEEA